MVFKDFLPLVKHFLEALLLYHLLGQRRQQKLVHFFGCKEINDNDEEKWVEYAALVYSKQHKESFRSSSRASNFSRYILVHVHYYLNILL